MNDSEALAAAQHWAVGTRVFCRSERWRSGCLRHSTERPGDCAGHVVSVYGLSSRQLCVGLDADTHLHWVAEAFEQRTLLPPGVVEERHTVRQP